MFPRSQRATGKRGSSFRACSTAAAVPSRSFAWKRKSLRRALGHLEGRVRLAARRVRASRGQERFPRTGTERPDRPEIREGAVEISEIDAKLTPDREELHVLRPALEALRHHVVRRR